MVLLMVLKVGKPGKHGAKAMEKPGKTIGKEIGETLGKPWKTIGFYFLDLLGMNRAKPMEKPVDIFWGFSGDDCLEAGKRWEQHGTTSWGIQIRWVSGIFVRVKDPTNMGDKSLCYLFFVVTIIDLDLNVVAGPVLAVIILF